MQRGSAHLGWIIGLLNPLTDPSGAARKKFEMILFAIYRLKYPIRTDKSKINQSIFFDKERERSFGRHVNKYRVLDGNLPPIIPF